MKKDYNYNEFFHRWKTVTASEDEKKMRKEYVAFEQFRCKKGLNVPTALRLWFEDGE